MHRLFLTKTLLFLSCLVLLEGCSGDSNQIEEKVASEITTKEEFLNQVSEGDKLLAIANQGMLELVNPANQTRLGVYEFDQNLPSRLKLDSFLISPSNKYVVWYVPAEGFVRYDISSGLAEVIHKPSDWFNSNPFMVMDEKEDKLMFIDDDGKKHFYYDLNTSNLTSEDIPFPHGTIFVVSPDGSKTVYIAGFGQSKDKPNYLYIDQIENQVTNFTTDTEIADRDKLVWLNDSSGFVVIEDGNKLMKYEVGEDVSSSEFVGVDEGARLIDIQKIGDDIYTQVIGGDWIVFDGGTGEQKEMIPHEIAEGLNKTKIIPWTNLMLILEETFVDEDSQFKRLWTSDNRGIRKMLIPEYYKINQISPTTSAN